MRVNTRIGGEFLFVECLNEVERHFGRVAELLVTFHLQRCKVVEAWRLFRTLFLLHIGNGERLSRNGLESLLALFLAGEPSFGGREGGVAVNGGQHPVGFRFEVVYFFLPVHDERQRGRLHPSDGEHLPVLSVFERIESGSVHAQNPVADGPGESC